MSQRKKSEKSELLSDESIIELYWARDEQAITETDRKYRHYLYTVAFNILHDKLDCEECLNDTYLGTWNAIPPVRPSIFQIFISKIMRNTAVVRYKHNHAAKRIPSEMTVSLDELRDYIPYDSSAEHDYAVFEISRLLSAYLHSLSEKRVFIFICRYYCSDKITDIADMLHVSESTVFRELNAIKQGLRERLVKEGYFDA